MRFATPFILLILPYLTYAVPSPNLKRDVGFQDLQGLTSVTHDRTGKKKDRFGKYFHESTFNPHYDARFADDVLPYDIRLRHLKDLVRTYLTTMQNIGAETWIMHGSLLGWWWNRAIMPWDSDIDVQVSESSIRFLADYYNMTVHHYNIPDVKGGRNYLLEVNPHYTIGSEKDWANVIDARWIDMDAGLFIDITTLRRNKTAEEEGKKGFMMCKDKHRYMEQDIFPLRDSVFEGLPVKVPYAYTGLLEEEYGPKSLTKTDFLGHHFDSEKMQWIQTNIQPEKEDLGDAPNRAERPHRLSSDGKFVQFEDEKAGRLT